jgi:hypothetical protein
MKPFNSTFYAELHQFSSQVQMENKGEKYVLLKIPNLASYGLLLRQCSLFTTLHDATSQKNIIIK